MPLLVTYFLPQRRHFPAVVISRTEFNQLRPSFDLAYLLLFLSSTDLKTDTVKRIQLSYYMVAHLVVDRILVKLLHLYTHIKVHNLL